MRVHAMWFQIGLSVGDELVNPSYYYCKCGEWAFWDTGDNRSEAARAFALHVETAGGE